MKDYTAWRITYQCSEQAARAAYRAAQQHVQHIENLRYAGNRVIRRGEGAHVWDLALKALPDDSPVHARIEELEEQASQAAAEREAASDYAQDIAVTLDMVAKALGVPDEPHQGRAERIIEAAEAMAAGVEAAQRLADEDRIICYSMSPYPEGKPEGEPKGWRSKMGRDLHALLKDAPKSLAQRAAQIEANALSWARTHYDTMDRVSARRKVLERITQLRQQAEEGR